MSALRPFGGDEDDIELGFFVVDNPDDRLDTDDELDVSQPSRVIDETGARAWWQSEFGNRN